MFVHNLRDEKDIFSGNSFLYFNGGLEHWSHTIRVFLEKGLSRKEKCLLIYDITQPEHIRKILSEKGLQLESYEKSGQCAFQHLKDSLYPEGYSMLTLYQFLIIQKQEAIAQGYSALRIVAENSLGYSKEATVSKDTKAPQLGTAICLSKISLSG